VLKYSPVSKACFLVEISRAYIQGRIVRVLNTTPPPQIQWNEGENIIQYYRLATDISLCILTLHFRKALSVLRINLLHLRLSRVIKAQAICFPWQSDLILAVSTS
jgi:hypothetical protein